MESGVGGVEKDRKLSLKVGERRGSLGNIEEMMKRKREEQGERLGKEDEDVFKRSNKTWRSPRKEKEEDEMKETLRKWGEEMKEIMKEIGGIKGWREEIRLMKEEVKEGIREQGSLLREEVEEMRREWREQERLWKEEKEEMKKCIKGLEKRVEEMERGKGKVGQAGEGEKEGERGKMEGRLWEIERKMEMKERDRRRRNVLIKGVEVKEGKREEAVEEIFNCIGVKVDIGEIKKIGGEAGKGGEILVVKLGKEEQRGVVLAKRKFLRG